MHEFYASINYFPIRHVVVEKTHFHHVLNLSNIFFCKIKNIFMFFFLNSLNICTGIWVLWLDNFFIRHVFADAIHFTPWLEITKWKMSNCLQSEKYSYVFLLNSPNNCTDMWVLCLCFIRNVVAEITYFTTFSEIANCQMSNIKYFLKWKICLCFFLLNS